MESLHHPNIIRLYEVIENLTKLHLVMEFANGGELFTKISSEGKLGEKTTKRMFSQIVAALDHMVRFLMCYYTICLDVSFIILNVDYLRLNE